MNIRNRGTALASAIAFALTLAALPALAASESTDADNARLESQIWTTYALNPYLRSNDIKVSVEDGEATLTGIVEEDVNKDLAEQIARGVDGVDDVDNQIEVRADFKPASRAGERPYGARIDDASTSAAVRSKLSWSQRNGSHPAEVETVDGKVTLKGHAASAEDKAFVTRLARNTPGVRSVDNRMVVGEGADPADADTSMATAVADSWITTKVKSTFMYSSNVNSSNITVSTLGGVVTLGGSVASGSERALAIELAQNVRGVKSVESSGLAFSATEEVASTPGQR